MIPRIDDGQGPRIGFVERCRIEELLREGFRPARIARLLGRARSSVIRELARCRTGRYRAVAANGQAAKARARPKPRKLEARPQLREQVVTRLSHHHSPEQVARRLRRDIPNEPEMWVSHETIYQALYVDQRDRPAVVAAVFAAVAQHDGRGRIQGMVNISERPAEVADRAVPGHWEGDLIIGAAGRSAIGTTVERTTGFLLLEHLPGDHTAVTVAAAITTTFATLPQHLRRSLTWDSAAGRNLNPDATRGRKLALAAHPAADSLH